MDQVKKYLALLKKHHFWVILGALVIITLTTWAVASPALFDTFTKNKAAINQKFQDMQSVQGVGNHPNDAVIARVKDQTGALSNRVLGAWRTMYDEQKKFNPLPDVLSKDFRAAFESIRPGQELDPKYRGEYQFFIRNYLPKLLETVRWRHKRDAANLTTFNLGGDENNTGDESGSGMLPAASDVEGIVDWNSTDWSAIEGRFRFPTLPTQGEVVLAQEDLWIYEALTRVIAATNSAAADYSSAPIKQIDAMKIGRAAAALWNAYRGGFSLPAAGDQGSGGSEPPPEDANSALIDGRYVDDSGKPLAAGASQPYAEFKMLPVYLKLLVDQEKIPRLLVECANSSMPIEVRMLRLSSVNERGGTRGETSADLDLASLSEGKSASGEEGTSGHYASASRHFAGGKGAGGEPVRELPKAEVTVELYGIVYIFNPPDREKLGTGTAADDAAAKSPSGTAASAGGAGAEAGGAGAAAGGAGAKAAESSSNAGASAQPVGGAAPDAKKGQ